MNNFDTIKFIDGDFEMDVNVSLEDNDIWLTSSQLCTLFGKTKSTISKHIKNILESDNPICEKARPTVAKKETVQIEGGKTVTRNIDYYNLDLIIAIGHKVNSIRGEKLKELLEQYLNEKYQDNSNIIIYNNGSLSLPVTISPEEDTAYLNLGQIAELFDTTKQNVSMHIKNIVEDGELDLVSTVKDFFTVQLEGGRKIKREVSYFNLDMILSIGYRVKSKNAIEFRRWVSSVLKNYMIKGYSFDTNRLIVALENNFQFKEELKKVIERIDNLEKTVYPKPIQDRTFVDALPFEVHVCLHDLFSIAKKSVIIIDTFCDITPLNYLKNLPKEIKKTIIQSKKGYITKEDINAYKLSYGELTVYINNGFHNRYLIIDSSQYYDLGSSFNRMDKIFSITKLNNEEDIAKLNTKIEKIIKQECLE